MSTLLIIRVDILAIIALLTMIFYDSYYHRQQGTKSKYHKFAIIILLVAIFGLITEITVNSNSVPKVVNDICHILYFTFSLLFSLSYFEYIISFITDTKKRKEVMIPAIFLSVLGLLTMFGSEILYLQGVDTKYSAGTGPTICYILGFVMFIVSDIIMIANRKKYPIHVIAALLPMSVITVLLMLIQILVPEFLFVESALTVLSIGVYFAIESPIVQSKEIDALNKKLDAERIMFRDAITKNSLCEFITDIDEGLILHDVIDKNGVDMLAMVGLKAPAKFDEYMAAISKNNDVESAGVEGVGIFSCEEIKKMYDEGTTLDSVEVHQQDTDTYIRLMPLLYKDPDTGHLMCFCSCEDITERNRKNRLIKEQLKRSIEESMRDELSGLYNRHAYEDDARKISKEKDYSGLAVVTVDVNGLKSANDSHGHVAGDEIILGTADCLKKSLGAFGKVYRIGGDEFIAILRNVNKETIEKAVAELDSFSGKWKGYIIESLSISVGYVLSDEVKDCDIYELQKIADKRMYDAKNEYYRKKGIDRRGQGHTFDSIYANHNQIIKLDLTDDSHSEFRKFKVDAGEQPFTAGNEESLKKFIAAGTYSEDGREIFLYVKDQKEKS